MHHNGAGRCILHQLPVDDVRALDLLVIGGIVESLPLDSRHVQYVGILQHGLIERIVRFLRHIVVLGHHVLDGLGHRQDGRGGVAEGDG